MASVTTLVVCGGLVATPGVASAKPRVNAHGFVECQGTLPGKAKISPPISKTPAAGTRTTTIKFKASCESTPEGAVTSAKVTATLNSPASATCASLAAYTEFGSTTFQIKWKGAMKANPTKIVYSSHYRYTYGAPGPLNGRASWVFPIFNSDPTPDGTATITGSGSYSGEFSTPDLWSSLSMSSLVATCNIKKGLKKFTTDGPNTLIDIDTAPLF